MASNSEVTFGSRVNNAQTLTTHVQSYTDYTSSSPALLPAALQTLVTNTSKQNETVASTTQAYSTAANFRSLRFQKDADSLVKLMSPISSELRSVFGKTSKEAAYIKTMVDKIRGVRVDKKGKQPNEEFVSQSERSYGSMTQNFSDVITTLTGHGSKYSPSNKKIQLPALKLFLKELTDSNIAVATAYGQVKMATDKRGDMYKTLTDTCFRVKEAVKSQYGVGSTEYSLIKGLKI